MVESSPNALVMVDKRGNIAYLNTCAEKLFQYNRANIIGKQVEVLLPDFLSEVHSLHREKYMQNPVIRSMGDGKDLQAIKKDGSNFPAEIGLNPIKNNGEVLVVASIIDVTERKSYESTLLEKNKRLEELSEELNKSNEKLENKNNHIIEGIQYAKKIQYSILPDLSFVRKHFSEFTIYFSPKEVIGGDFYWFFRKNGLIYIAVVDCTGHSVPGALMSLIINDMLNYILGKKRAWLPGEILEHLHSRLYLYLKQENGELYSQDGCDISLCLIDKENKELKFAGAYQNLYILNKNMVDIINGTKKSIGGLSMLGEPDAKREFKTHTLKLKENHYYVLTTDGILDQLNKKDDCFGTKRFTKMVLDLKQSQDAQREKKMFKSIEKWKKGTTQLDDMLMVMFKA